MNLDETEGLPPRRPSKPRPRPDATPLQTGQETFRPSLEPGPRATRTKKEPLPVSGGPNFVERVLFGRVSAGHLANFCGQFARYSEAGVDVLKALSSLQRQFAHSALGPVIERLEVAVRSGDSLSTAMEREPQAFDNLCLSMMRVAEARGAEPETLKGLARHYEAKQRMIRQARSAMIYPTIVLTISLGVILLVSIFVIPKMVSFLIDSARGRGVDLPLPTRVLLQISDFMTGQGWWLAPLILVGGIVALFKFYKVKSGRAAMDAISLYIPVLGKIRGKLETTRFARTLSALLAAGVDVGTSLELTSGVLGISSYQKAVRGVRSEVMDGTEISVALAATRIFETDVVAMVESGEESGQLPESLEKVASSYEEQVEYMLKNLGNLIQPMIMVFMGGIVLFIILGVLLPYIQMLTSAAGG